MEEDPAEELLREQWIAEVQAARAAANQQPEAAVPQAPAPARLPPGVVPPPGAAANEAGPAETPGLEKPDWLTAENEVAQCQVYLVTFSAVLAATALQAATPLVTLEGKTREQVRDAVLDAVANPLCDRARGGRPRGPSVVVKLVTFLEKPCHFHVALKLNAKKTFLPFKRALRARSGLASHWSTSHTEWWSAVRYGVMATEHKPRVDANPLVWPEGLNLNLFEESQRPWSAHVVKRRREEAEKTRAGGGQGAKSEKQAKKEDRGLNKRHAG